MSTAKEWKVRFRSCGIHWADRERVTDYTALWDHIPWNDRLTERVTDDEASARAQYETLRAWERDRSQPVRDVELLVTEQPIERVWRVVES